jgi:hypothetical protein
MNALLMPANFSIQLTGKLIRKIRQKQKQVRWQKQKAACESRPLPPIFG